jgi:hypothetical protein
MADYLRNRPFFCVEITHRAAPGVNTSQKGWQNQKGALASFDKVSIVDRVSTSLNLRAAVIIDIINSAVVRNTTGMDDTVLRAQYMGKYSEDIKEALTIWAVKEANSRVVQ